MTDTHDPSKPAAAGRRNFLRMSTTGAMLPLVVTAPPADAANATDAAIAGPRPTRAEGPVPIRLSVNGRPCAVSVDVRATLLDVLRDALGLTGTKKGCDHGQCGACTVHVAGQRQLSCLTLAVAVVDEEVLTIEGLARPGGSLHPLQQAFIDHDALQCGYCTPGQLMSAACLVRDHKDAAEDEIREYMSGNLCRCAAYPQIVSAIRQVLSTQRAV